MSNQKSKISKSKATTKKTKVSDENKKYDELTKRINELESSKKQWSKKKKILVSTGVILGIGAITGITVGCILHTNKQNSIVTYAFTLDDYINFRTQINTDIDHGMSYERFKNHLLDYFKYYFKASNQNISNQIKSVSIIEKLDNSITFKVILEPTNSKYVCNTNDKFNLVNNELIIEYSTPNAIDFLK